jgi:hypothetical protein
MSPRRASLGREIFAVRRSLAVLDRALSRLAAQAKNAGRAIATPTGRVRRKLKLSPARRKALQLHGKYMGYVRQLKPRAKAQVTQGRNR